MLHSVAETLVPTDKPAEMLDAFKHHLKEDHAIDFVVLADGVHLVEQDLFRVEFQVDPAGLRICLQGPNDNALVFFKEEIVEHVSQLDADAAHGIRWSGASTEAGALPTNFAALTVLDNKVLFEGMQRVTLRYPGIAKRQDEGLHVRLMMPLDQTRDPVWPVMGENGAPVWPQGADKLHARFVTLRNVRPEHEEVDIDIVPHDVGLISQWAQNAQAGQTVGAMGPAGMSKVPEAGSYLFVADGTGLPLVARLLETLGDEIKGDVILAAPNEAVLDNYLPQTSLRVHCIDAKSFESNIVAQVKKLTKATAPDYALFAGEFQNAQDLRKHFKGDLGLDKKTQISVAYWKRGVNGYGS